MSGDLPPLRVQLGRLAGSLPSRLAALGASVPKGAAGGGRDAAPALAHPDSEPPRRG